MHIVIELACQSFTEASKKAESVSQSAVKHEPPALGTMTAG